MADEMADETTKCISPAIRKAFSNVLAQWEKSLLRRGRCFHMLRLVV
jgi:hypothetical protein